MQADTSRAAGIRCHRGRLSRSDPAPRIRHARKASERGSTILRTPSDHFVATCALRRPTTRRAQNRDLFGAAARFTTRPSPTRAVTPELGIRINAVSEWWPEVSDPLLTDLTPMRSSPQPTAFNLRRMCCRSLRGPCGAFHEGLTWRGAPNGHPSFFERRIFIRSG